MKKFVAFLILFSFVTTYAQVRTIVQCKSSMYDICIGDTVVVYGIEINPDSKIARLYVDKGGIYNGETWVNPEEFVDTQEHLQEIMTITPEQTAKYQDSSLVVLKTLALENEESLKYIWAHNREFKKRYPTIQEEIKARKEEQKAQEIKDLYANGEYITFSNYYSESGISNMDTAGRLSVLYWIRNNSSKTIKYVYLTLKFKNAVGDYVSWSNRTSVQIELTGPVGPYKEKMDNWLLDFWNTTAEKSIITSVKIIYDDNTQKILPQNKIRFVKENFFKK